jgi:hypothetical protein
VFNHENYWLSSAAIRVIRLCAFSSIGRFLLFGKVYIQLSQIFLPLFTMEQVHNLLIWAKNGLGNILGHFFANSSGHSVRRSPAGAL